MFINKTNNTGILLVKLLKVINQARAEGLFVTGFEKRDLGFLRRQPAVWRMTVALVVMGLAWRVIRYLLNFPLWGDEAFIAVNFLTRDYAGLCRQLEFRQVAPPAFLWAELGMTRIFGPSERVLRFLPFLAGIASLLLFWKFSRSVTTKRVTLLAVAFFAASFFPVRHATEVKPYSIDLLISIAVTFMGLSVWRARRSRSLVRWLALTGLGVVGVWCSYTAVFPIASTGLWLIIRNARERSLARALPAIAFSLAAGVSWAAMMLLFSGPQLAESPWLRMAWTDGFPPLNQPWRLPVWFVYVHTSDLMAYPYGGPNFSSTATAILVVLGSVSVASRRQRRPLVPLLLGPLPIAIAAAALQRYPYGTSTRLMLYMAPAICLLAAEGISTLLQYMGERKRGPIVVAGILAIVPIVCIIVDISMPYRRAEDLEYRRLAERLAADCVPGESWFVFDGADPLPRYPLLMTSIWVQRVAKLRYYLLSRTNVPVRLVSDPSQIDSDLEGRTIMILHDHGFARLYPRYRFANFEPVLTARLGQPRTTVHKLPVGSTVYVHKFDQEKVKIKNKE